MVSTRHVRFLAVNVAAQLLVMQSTWVFPAWSQSPAVARVREGLLVLYQFEPADGAVVHDSAGVGEPLDLQIDRPAAVRRRSGLLEIRQPTVIHSTRPANKISDAIRESKELTIEAWLQPANTNQQGPARIVTFSSNTVARNFTLGQDGDRIDVRLRTTKTDDNGLPSLASLENSFSPRRNHVAFTRRRTGHTRLYLNGKVVAEGMATGELSNWNDSFRLGIANEVSGDRAWLGTFYLVAVYSKSLYTEEIQQNFAAGIGSSPIAETQVASQPTLEPNVSAQRVARSLQVLYDFNEDAGPIVRDRSRVGKPYDLRATKPKFVRRAAGAWEVHGATMLRSEEPMTRVAAAVRRSGAFTVEAWISPAEKQQVGPARIVSLSRDGSSRNFTLGQDGERYDVRFRTTKTSENGIPSLGTPDKTVQKKITHVVYTRSRQGISRIFVDGQQVAESRVEGDTANWDESFRLVLADEHSQDRQWLGTYDLVALYSRDLKPAEVQQNFAAGSQATAGNMELVESPPDPGAFHFETKIAPLISRHCLECHDSPANSGGLDLSRRDSALAGGETGKAILAGNADESLLWDSVASDTMPADRPSLSPDEKSLLKNWINDGATWSLDLIDPAVYAHAGDATNCLQRLTVPEYIATVRDTVGIDIAAEARHLLPPDLRADGFSNTAYNLNVDLKHVNAYAKLAQIIVTRMDVDNFAAQFSKTKKFTDKDMGDLIHKLGKRLLRGSLDEQEVISYRGISTSVAAGGGSFEEAVGFIVEAMLQSPRFIYRIENHQGDGTAWRADDYELASRVSYIVWGAPPDPELMRAADAGELESAGIREQLNRMLDDPRARERSLLFAAEWLNLDRLDNLQPNRERYGGWRDSLAKDMRDETLALFDEVVWGQKRPLTDLLNAQFTVVSPDLARHYGLELSDDGDRPANEPIRYDLSQVSHRGGLLTHGSILTVGGDEASMVTRGLFVMHDLLRGVVRDPPPCVDTTPVPSKPGLTQRDVSEARIANESCGGCHVRFEPLAFGLEKFDGLGGFHERDEHGNSLREDGEILFPGRPNPVKFSTSAELMDLLANSDRVRDSITWKLTQFALGRPLGAQDAATVALIRKSAAKHGGRYTDVITAIIMSDLVQLTRTEGSQTK